MMPWNSTDGRCFSGQPKVALNTLLFPSQPPGYVQTVQMHFDRYVG